ncbi:TonB-dependent receptor [Planctobacterium marinum]|uniref:TonB-dependent receptor n=1 Tax=Planctobacterium marinum TaxID=1631968 RepID=A0AA48HMT5_9ALTE|nr:hypothetical protein MACH26_02600 [Planctobacterium marinum]
MFHKRLIFSFILIFASANAFAIENAMDTIVVTGTRNNLALAEVNSNLSRVNQQEIATIAPTHITEVTNRVPGVWISRGNGQEHLTSLRSPVLTGAGACGAFYMAEDGISLRAPGFCNANQLFDINTLQSGGVEVLRGPAGVVYGSNAVHGVINLLSPDWQRLPELSVALEAGPNQYNRQQFVAKSSHSEHKFAVYGVTTNDGGYKNDSGFEQQKFDLLHQKEHRDYSIKNRISYSNLDQETAGFIQGFEAYEDAALKQVNPNPEAYRDSRSFRAWSQIEFAYSGAQFLLKPYLRYHDMAFLQHFLPWQATEENGQRSLGMLSSMAYQYRDIKVTTGVDVDSTEGWLKEFQEEPFSAAIPQGEHYDYEVQTTSLSPYVDLQYQLNDTLALLAGLRYEHSRYDYENLLSDGNACATDVDNCRFYRPEDQVRTFSNWSAKLGLHYSLSASQFVYSQLSHGYRAPQATELFRLQNGQVSANLDSENMVSLELGLRGQWQSLNQSIFYDVSLYCMEKSDHIFQDTQRRNVSEGETRHDGMELSINWQFTPSWQWTVALDYARHTYDNNPAITSGTDIRGNDIDTAPRFNANSSLKWSQDDYHVELEWYALDSYYLDPANTAKYDGHQLLNLRAAMPLSEHFSLSFRLLNLLDEDYAERADFAFGNYRYFVGEPRSLFITLSASL